MFRLIQEKEARLCSKRYLLKDRSEGSAQQPTDAYRRSVFPDDAEDIKAHRWFKNFPWDRIHSIRPPFVPQIRGVEDTRYFDESEPLEDESESDESDGPASVDVRTILGGFRDCVQRAATDLLTTAYDSARLRSADHRIDANAALAPEERKLLKHFIRIYGRKEPKRPRDILLRDESTRSAVLAVRRELAFVGYAWRRMRPGGYDAPAEGSRPAV